MWLTLLNFPNVVQAPEGLPRLKSWVRIPFPAPLIVGCNPDTWVALHSEDIGNTLPPNGFLDGLESGSASSKYPRS